jgi:hypothetical protein
MIMRNRFATPMTLLSIGMFFCVPLVNAAYYNITLARTGEASCLLGSPVRFQMDANVRKTYPEHPLHPRAGQVRWQFGSASVIAIAVSRRTGRSTTTTFCRRSRGSRTSWTRRPASTTTRSAALAHQHARDEDRARRGDRGHTAARGDPRRRGGPREAARHCARENPGVIYGQLVSHDHRAALINAGFITRSLDNSAAYTELFNYLQNLKAEEEADGTAEIYLSGAPLATGFVVSQAGEMIGFLLLTIVSLFFLLLAYFRRLHGVAIPMVAGLATAIWGMGFCAWMGIKLDRSSW